MSALYGFIVRYHQTAKDRNCKKGKLQQTETELMVLAIVILFDTYVMLRSGRLGT